MRLIQLQLKQSDARTPLSPPRLSSSTSPQFPSPSTPPSSSGSKINPVVLFIIVILAVLFFISGLLHLFVKFLLRKRSSSSTPQSSRHPEMSGSDAFHRQLQTLFHLHDSGLDQAFIDALPVFLYKEIMGLKEPFDCAVCLCEFSEQDSLRLLPLCGHAFHIDCIDTWLLSNSTCPLCRGTLFTPGFSMENPVFEFDDSREEDSFSGSVISLGVSCGQKPAAEDDNIVGQNRIFPVRLGKFRSTNDDGEERREVGETSNSNLDARRCYSMGSFQYVVASSDLQVAYRPNRGGRDRGSGGIGNDERVVKGRYGQFGNFTTDGDGDGKRINTRSKGESFSVSKIWMWSKKGKLTTTSSDSPMVTNSSVNVSLPWTDRNHATAT